MNYKDCLALILLSALLGGCAQKKEGEAKETKERKGEAAPEPESRVKHGTNGEVIVTVEAKLQATIGLQTAALQPTKLSPELRAYGRVMDPSSLASTVAELVAAEAANQASQSELTRLKTLAAQSNASERAVQTAQASAVRDQAQVQAIRLRLLASWGSAISERTDLPGFVQSLGSLTSAVVELQVPAGQAVPVSPTGARLFALSDETHSAPGQLLGPAPSVDPQMQGQGFLFLVAPNTLKLSPGAAVTGWLSFPGEPLSGVLLPRQAVVWFNGAPWVYRQTSEESFERKEAGLGSPLADGWFVVSGLKPQDKVVTVGSQQLLSEELKGQIGGD